MSEATEFTSKTGVWIKGEENGGSTVLHAAAVRNRAHVLKDILLAGNIAVDTLDDLGYSACSLAGAFGVTGALRFLITEGQADVNKAKKQDTGATVLEGHSEAARSMAVSGTRIFSTSDDSTICVWDISTLTHTRTLAGHTGAVRGSALTRNEQHLVSCSEDKSLKVWCTASLSCLRTVQLDYHSYTLAVSQPGDVVADRVSATWLFSRLSTGACLGKLDSQSCAVALSPCGRWVFSPTNDASVTVSSVSSVSP